MAAKIGPMQITFGGYPIQCATQEAANLAALGLPAPADFDRANSLYNPLGRQPARGWLLMLRQDLERLDVNGLQTLKIQDDLGNTVSVSGLVLTREPAAVTPSGSTSDPNACFLLEVSDARWRCSNPNYAIPVNVQYNVRAPGWGSNSSPVYYASSLDTGSTWTWSGLLGSLWELMTSQLGSYPGLPTGFSPDGIPEGFRFIGVSAWGALCDVLDKLGLAVAWNPLTGKYSIVQIGASDTTTASLLSAAAGRIILDRQMPAVVRGRVPASVRVYFHRLQEHRGSEPSTESDATQFVTGAAYSVDVAGTAAQTDGAEPDSLAAVWDDVPAVYDPAGSLLNGTALSTRAATRAAAYYATIQGTGGSRLHQVYSGLVKAQPGSTLRGVLWRQDQGPLGGLVTEVFRAPHTPRLAQPQYDGVGRIGATPAEDDSSPLQPPDFGVKEPVYPDLLQTVRVTSTSPTGGIYPAVVECYNPDTAAWIDRETVGLLGANGETLTTQRYLARLVGYASGAPLYVVSAPSGGSSSLAVDGNLPGTGDPSLIGWSGITTIFLNQGSGFSLSQPSGGQVEITMQGASATHAGAVTLAAQTFAGDKTLAGHTITPWVWVCDSTSLLYSGVGSLLTLASSPVPSSTNADALYITNNYPGSTGGFVVFDFYPGTSFGGRWALLLGDSNKNPPHIYIGNGSGYDQGQTTTISYAKPGGGSGTMTFNNGLLTAFT